MDSFELPREMPGGLAEAMLRNGKAMQRWAQLGEDGRRKLLERVREAGSGADYDAVVASLVGWEEGHGPKQL